MTPAKAALRKQLKAKRATLSGVERARRAELLIRFMPWDGLHPRAIIAGYWPLVTAHELDPRPLLVNAIARGFTCALPAIDGQTLVFKRWTTATPMRAGEYGTLEPHTEAETLTPSLVLAPLLGFDRVGTRLGYGGGYYDRCLKGLREITNVQFWGLAFTEQAVACLPREAHDIPLDAVLTDAAYLSLNNL